MAVWYFGKPTIPVAGLVLAFAALLVPVAATFWFPEGANEYELLLWLLALVPAFLLAHYRGWLGVAVAMLIGMVVLSLAQVAAVAAGLHTNWTLLLGVVAVYIAVGLSVGVVSELLHNERARAEELALTDGLTEMPNRRLADLFLDKEFGAAQRGRSLAVVLFDIDHFKVFNDDNGHAAGDQALRYFADILKARTRRMDLSARYGGEEFISILSAGSAYGAVRLAESVRELLAAQPHHLPFTISAGVAEFADGMEDPAELVAAADRALYEAKSEGRDCVRGYQPA